ncbi:PadR family transcriptional regulator [Actinomycetospora straminea]|uniref:Transcription regulator PadR N-terminal domain-containing protein n=1 Tax=Actinomycetospora straminea TaxID=663607 RepID=A0ABP9E7B2_9PSEU|nr:PadR family transcriptional regulator [Actinomycetospora straminea]MDD7932581.1 PadR family transcriptional regulator [Actinomycetospora straminea]
MTAEPSTSAEDPDLSSAFGRPAASSLRGLLPPRPRRSAEQDDRADEVGPEETDGPVDEELVDEEPDADDVGAEPADEAWMDAPDDAPADDAPVVTVPSPRERRDRAARRERRGTARRGERSDRADPAPAVPAPRGAGAGTGTGTGTGTGNHRWGSVRMASREHVELLVLVALRRGPASGRELAERLREDSGGGLTPPPTTVQRTLHQLARHGLVQRDGDPARRRYRLTTLGIRITRARVRAWRAMQRAVDAVVLAADKG